MKPYEPDPKCEQCGEDYALFYTRDLGWVCSKCHEKSEDYKPGGGYPRPEESK